MNKTAVSGIIFAAALLVGLISVKTYEYYNARIFPRSYINSVAVGGLTIEEAVAKLNQQQPNLPQGEVVVRVDDIAVASDSSQLGLAYRYDDAARKAHSSGKNNTQLARFFNIIGYFIKPHHYHVSPSFDPVLLEEMLTEMQLKVDVIGERPQATMTTSGNSESISINPGLPGRILEVDGTIENIQKAVAVNQLESTAVIASTSATLSEDEQLSALERAKKFAGHSLVFETDLRDYSLPDTELVSLLTFPTGFSQLELKEVLDQWAEGVNREPQDAVFDYNPETLEVEKFIPDKNGQEIDVDATTSLISESINQIENEKVEGNITLTLPVTTTQANVPLAGTNNLGIIERIGFGDSEYDHSIPNRVHNVKITTDRIANTIVAPGEEFSFNKALGEVSARTGYRSAYVIKNGRTELGDGGGVCQVSTTLFRSVLNSGLPVTLRLPHSYRVSYYELDSKPGVDATVYSGNVDFRFVNDTGKHLLIHGTADSNDLYMYFEIYGTSDGRTAEIVDHQVWGYQPPPAPEYIEDPEKPPGYREQVDWAAAGIKASFKSVVKNSAGEVIREEEYYSNYRPWSAKYIVGPGGV